MEQPPADLVPTDAAVESLPPPDPHTARPSPGPRRVAPVVRILAALAVLAVAGTYLAAQIDFVRRHTLGFPPLDVRRYWVLQIKVIWARGLAAALLLAAAAFLLHRRKQAD
jgi:hypothetical protein